MNEAHGCANCGAPLTGPYCVMCGQSAHDSAMSFGGWLRESAGDAFSLEGRTWRTARDMFRPGRLSEAWAAGRRARYVPPVRVFLLSSLVFFSVAFLLGPMSPQEGARAFNDAAVASVARRTATEIVVLSVPVVALTLALLLYRRRRYFIEHVVFALHLVSVVLLFLAVAWALSHLLSPSRRGGFALLACAGVTLIWTVAAVRRFYAVGITYAAAAVVGVVVAFGALSQPLASFANGRLHAYDRARDAESRRSAERAYASAQRRDLPAELRRVAATTAFTEYLELDQREALTDADRPRFACLALELDMPEHAARIDSTATVARCTAGL